MSSPILTPDVAIVGAGPAGLAAATALGDKHGISALVLDREQTAGGIPRHCDHPGYGIRDLHTFISGPNYAKRLTEAAVRAGADIRTSATVTAMSADRTLQVTTPAGLLTIAPKALVLATGARERARPARLIPGDRPQGVYTTGQLQNIVHLQHKKVGKHAVIVGAELVSWSAAMTLRHAGCRPVLMTTEYPSPESYAAFNIPGTTLLRVPVRTRTRIVGITGKHHLESVEVENIDTGARDHIACDTLIFSGDWIPDHELPRAAGITLDPATLGPLVDTALRTDAPGVFAAGNMLHPVDTADIAALDGTHVADRVADYLATPSWASPQQLRITCEAPLRWVAPGLMAPGEPAPPRQRLLLWTDELVRRPRVAIHQDGHLVASKTLPWPASPGRVFRVPWSIMDRVRPDGGDVSVSIDNARATGFVPGRRALIGVG
ncbi:NAD(P)/FAD-dependent oxidoreductase [Gordonia rhizosphera]|uniref:Putative oxidoreductase n=1 Tax=Gordonia rhizosphera NBRC 16068 TaxID=1108045 RepID=K6WQP3_9ACTN|nr:FAD-dependent oxidoreductase [Gordonia rhizosphera]GAB88839.1 putative oxidoreductase [Gordonia rhizosphera NBRC 16068]